MEWVETTGKTVAEALDAALDQLGVDEQEAEYEVLEEAQRGLFGRLRSEARVRARVRPVRPRPKAERRDRRRRGGDRSGGGGERGRGGRGRGSGSGAGNGDAKARSNGGRSNGNSGGGASSSGTSGGSGGGRRVEAAVGAASGGAGEQGAVTTVDTEPGGPSEGPDGAGGGTSGSRRRRRRRRGGRGGGANRTGADVATENRDDEVAAGAAFDVEAQRAAVEEFLTGLLGAFGRPEAEVSVTVVEDATLEADVKGEELGLLVGPKGQTLQAVHELIRSMVQRRFVGEAHARVRVDIAGYRQRRREALERFTRRIAEEVIATGRAKALDPMQAGDRKVVHDVANEIEGVTTRSEGEEPSRRVVIQPAS